LNARQLDHVQLILLAITDITERKVAEEALQASEERYRLLVESAQEYAIFMLDPAGRITSWNTGAERIFGYGEAEALGQLGAVIFTAEDRAAGAPEVEMATARYEGQASDDRWHVRRDGSRFWANGVMEALRHEDGALRGFAKVLRDNTKPKEAADALQESQARYQQALEAAQLGTWRYDVETDINYFDARSQAIFGLDRATYTAAEIDPLIHPDDLATVVQARNAALEPKGDGACHYVHRVIHPDGAVRWVRLNCQVTFAGAGQKRHPVQAVGVIADVTERREAANALRASEERFRALVDASAQMVWTTDAQGVVVEDSPSWRAVTGQSYAEFAGWGWLDVIHPADQRATAAAWQQAVATVTPYYAECRVYHAACAQYRWNVIRAVPLQNADGAVRGWVGMNSDIQQRKEAEAALYALNESLEARVRERTQQVRELVTQLAMSEQAERHRISQILHDDLQQRLFGLQYQLIFLRDALSDSFGAGVGAGEETTSGVASTPP
ncbi:MAG: PAS domain S-box protein, partial [Caldilineaceae bacterium]|nr:PAS domain S-box protein [Caldilineaceae bacterium]